MKNYYIARVNVIVDGNESVIETVAGLGYDLNVVKRVAIRRVKERFPNSENFAAVLISNDAYNYDDYKKMTCGNPGWIIEK
ncbi:hypothetical protein SDC9_02088 [bioreactor metagenome]|uniref:Uncharacterized protein n=1 Tax=bioreactor metagenome TaxID=1076179 RepID=A0A644SSF6_9ZZZZ